MLENFVVVDVLFFDLCLIALSGWGNGCGWGSTTRDYTVTDVVAFAGARALIIIACACDRCWVWVGIGVDVVWMEIRSRGSDLFDE